MLKQYVGHLPAHDPLHHYLQYDILPQVGLDHPHVKFRVFRMGGSNDVYLYEEKYSRVQVVGKFFAGNGDGGSRLQAKYQRMEQEFHNLHLMRGYGLVGYPHDVVRPLGYNGWLNSLLVEEYCGGQPLSEVITDAIHSRQQDRLYRLVRKLSKQQFISWDEVQEFSWLRDRWREQPRMWEDQQVLVHGDATPSNFLFEQGLSVIGIDLERMKRADRVFDIGRITGELQHFFLQSTGNKYAAEPFIGHFLWEYACHFPDRDSAFRSICGRVPFQMGLTLLRIARNSWVSPDYRRRLIEEAKIILRSL